MGLAGEGFHTLEPKSQRPSFRGRGSGTRNPARQRWKALATLVTTGKVGDLDPGFRWSGPGMTVERVAPSRLCLSENLRASQPLPLRSGNAFRIHDTFRMDFLKA